jgi:hypothetical protein
MRSAVDRARVAACCLGTRTACVTASDGPLAASGGSGSGRYRAGWQRSRAHAGVFQLAFRHVLWRLLRRGSLAACWAQARPPECRHLADFRPERRPASNRNGWPASSQASSCSLEGQGCREISARTGLQGCGCAHKEKCRAEAGHNLPYQSHKN